MTPNRPAAPNPAIALMVYSWPQWRRVAEAERYASPIPTSVEGNHRACRPLPHACHAVCSHPKIRTPQHQPKPHRCRFGRVDCCELMG